MQWPYAMALIDQLEPMQWPYAMASIDQLAINSDHHRSGSVSHGCGRSHVVVVLVHFSQFRLTKCPPFEPLFHLGHDEDRRRDRHQVEYVHERQWLGDEYFLEWRPVDHKQLGDDGASHGEEERFVAEQAQAEHGLGLQ